MLNTLGRLMLRIIITAIAIRFDAYHTKQANRNENLAFVKSIHILRMTSGHIIDVCNETQFVVCKLYRNHLMAVLQCVLFHEIMNMINWI